MAQIESFTKATCRIVAQRIEALLKPLEEELGVAIQYKGGTFAAGNFVAKIELAKKSENGEIHTREADDFKALAPTYGLSPDDLGRTFRSGHREFKIVGLRIKATRHPIMAVSGGKEYRFPAEDVRRLLPGGSKAPSPTLKQVPLSDVLKPPVTK